MKSFTNVKTYSHPVVRSAYMQTLLTVLSGIALLVWGTHIVRTGVLRVFGGSLRRVLGEQRVESASRRSWRASASPGWCSPRAPPR